MGFITPVIMVAKYLFQSPWVSCVGPWDNEIPGEQQREFQMWQRELAGLQDWQVLGQFIPLPWVDCLQRDFRQHVFCDASEHGYSAVV